MAKTIEIIGDEQLEKLFLTIGAKLSRRVMNNLHAPAARIIQKRAREKVPVKTGNLKRSIVTRRSKSKRWPHVWVGPNYFKGKARGPHAHLVAFQSNPRATRTGAYRGRSMEHKQPLGQFIQEAADEVQGEVFARLKKSYALELEKQMKKIIKK
jgi:hypothetical protein